MQRGANVGCLFLVHLVQFYDAPWPLGPGAAVDAAEAEAAARTRHHEPAALRQRRQPLLRRLHKPWHVGSAGLAHTVLCRWQPSFLFLAVRRA